jgi:acyl-CoA thioesterase FadM
MPAIDQFRICLDDIDAAGVIFAPRLIALVHRSIETILAKRGLDFAAIIRQGIHALPVVRIETEFLAPLRHGDEVTVSLSVHRLGTRSVTFAAVVSIPAQNHRVAAKVMQTQVAIDIASNAAVDLPAPWRMVLTSLLSEQLT